MAAGSQESMSMRATLFAIRNAFPKVKQLETEELERWMKGEEGDNVILLDVRGTSEYKVSHLSGAILIKPDEPIDHVITKIKHKLRENVRGRSSGHFKIVAYCSLGYRSSSMAQKIYQELKRLKNSEDSHVIQVVEIYNLEGSIFKWANEGRRMVNCENEETPYCHPYNIIWGKLLEYNLRKYEPESAIHVDDKMASL